MNIEALCAALPEALAHSSIRMPLSCPVAPPSQRELHKDGGGGGGGVARRARAARAPKVKSCATSCGTSSTTPCAASSTSSSFICHLKAGAGCVWGGGRVQVAARSSISFSLPPNARGGAPCRDAGLQTSRPRRPLAQLARGTKGFQSPKMFAVQPRPGGTCSPRRAGSSRGRFESSTRVVLGWFPATGGRPSILWGCGGVGRSQSGSMLLWCAQTMQQGRRMGVS